MTKDQDRRKSTRATSAEGYGANVGMVTGRRHGSVKSPVINLQSPRKFEYDREAKCWRGAATGTSYSSQFYKIQKRLNQERGQNPDDLRQTSRNSVENPEAEVDLDTEEDAWSVSLDPQQEPVKIQKPFLDYKSPDQSHKLGVWSKPGSARVAVETGFRWEKPVTSGGQPSASSSASQRILALEKELADRDHVIQLLRSHLFKGQQDNVRLVDQLAQCTGQKYGEVIRENQALRQQTERQERQLSRLWAQQQRGANSDRIRKQEREAELESRRRQEFTSYRAKNTPRT